MDRFETKPKLNEPSDVRAREIEREVQERGHY